MQRPNSVAALLPGQPLQALRGTASFSWSSEIRHLASGKLLSGMAWPYYRLRQRYLTASPVFTTCKKLPGFNRLWSTIQKSGFAYDTLLLSLNPWQRSPTDLADLTTLALFWGDAFIDGIAQSAGKPMVVSLLRNDPELFYLQVDTHSASPELYYRFDLAGILPASILREVNPDYGITYQHFYALLQQFLGLINQSLAALSPEMASDCAGRIAEACNTCLDSFLADIRETSPSDQPRDISSVLHYHELKTACMQKKLLALRCALAGNQDAMNSSQASGWLDLMRVIQIYDDIHDPIVDHGIQDNLLLSAAFHLFPAEWKWFLNQKSRLLACRDSHLLFSAHMPGSMECCLQLASARIRPMNWEQQKIMHYLILRNHYSVYGFESVSKGPGFLASFYRCVRSRMPHLSNTVVKSFAIDTAVHLPSCRRDIAGRLCLSEGYQLRFNPLALTPETKAGFFDQILRSGYRIP